MATKSFTIAVLLLVAMASTYSTCKKGIGMNCAETKYAFQTYIQIKNDLDSIKIKDTIWIDFTCPTTLQDINTGKNIDYSNAQNIGTAINYLRVIGGDYLNPGVTPAANDFDYLLVKGEFVPDDLLPEKNRDYRFEESENKYEFKLGIIPKKTGIYALGLSDATDVFRKNDPCTKASFLISFADTNQHLYLYQNSRPGYQISKYESEHMYCFKVY